jgi:hypothetical protein
LPPPEPKMSETRERLRATFDSVADRYEAARPSYPESLCDDLVALAGLSPGDRLLEIGCATGLDTFSGHLAMAPPKRQRLYREVRARIGARPDRRVRRHWHAILHVARRRG